MAMHSLFNFIIKWCIDIYFPPVNTHIYTHVRKLHVGSHSLCRYCGTSFPAKRSQTITGEPVPLTPAFLVCIDGICIQSEGENLYSNACTHTYTSFGAFKIKYA